MSFEKLNIKWDRYFLGLAKYISTASKDISTKVGCCIVSHDRRLISTGYNGLPSGVDDSKEILEDREKKLACILHSEANAILFARQDLTNCCIYTFPFAPCGRCTSLIIQAGIKRVVCPEIDKNSELYKRWEKDFILSEDLFRQAGVELVKYRNSYKILGTAECVNNTPDKEEFDYSGCLLVGKTYDILEDVYGCIRIVDESGEDYYTIKNGF
jgi:dCMP deaminase